MSETEPKQSPANQESPSQARGELPPPEVPSERYNADYYLHSCIGSDEWRESEGRERAGFYDGVLDLAGLHRGDAVLDLGTGRGEFLVAALERGAVRAAGVEYSDAAVKLARQTLAQSEIGARAELVAGDARELPFPSESFDLVTMLDVVEHLTADELSTALAEARRVLRPGGRIFIHTFPTRTLYNFTYRLQRLSRPTRIRRWPSDPRNEFEQAMHVGEQSLASLKRSLRSAGFGEIKVTPGKWVYVTFIPDERARLLYHRLARIPLVRRLAIADLWGHAVRP